MSIFIFVVWILILMKVAYDQRAFFYAYKAGVDPLFEIPPIGITRHVPTINKILQITFGKYPKQPDVDRLAKKVRRDAAGIITFFVLIVLTSIILE